MDLLGRLRTRSSAGVTETFTYDSGTYGKGHLTNLSDATGSTTFGYNAAGSLTSKVSTINGTAYSLGWTYDAAGRLTAMTYPNGFALGYDYDAYGRLSRVRSSIAGTWATLADTFLYQPPIMPAMPGASAMACRARLRWTGMAASRR